MGAMGGGDVSHLLAACGGAPRLFLVWHTLEDTRINRRIRIPQLGQGPLSVFVQEVGIEFKQ